MEAGQQVDSCCVGTPDYLAPEIFLGMGHGTALLGHWEFFFFFGSFILLTRPTAHHRTRGRLVGGGMYYLRVPGRDHSILC